MNARRLNTVLWSLAAAFAVASLAVLAAAVLAPTPPATLASGTDGPANAPATAPQTSATTRPSSAPDAPGALPPLAAFESTWAAPLRRLGGREAGGQSAVSRPRAGPVAVQPASAPLTLVGTIGDSLALLRRADGVVEVREVGDEVAGAVVLAVRRSQVDLRINGRAVTLDRPAVVDEALMAETPAEGDVPPSPSPDAPETPAAPEP